MAKILIDTNILFSAMLLKASQGHDIVLCDRNIAELREMLARKAPHLLPYVEIFLAELPYELLPAIYNAEKLIRDSNDKPILNAAIVYGVDIIIIITGDKDFLSLNIEYPKCITASEFLKNYPPLNL